MVEHAAIDVEEQEGRGGALAPPYISFLQLLNLFDWLRQEGVPHRFDRSFWSRKYSGSMGPQMLSALRFLGLLKGDTPQPDLERLTSTQGDDRKAILAEVLRRSYTAVDFDLLPKATPGMMSDWLGAYPGGGDTKRKIESFFINALKHVEMPIAPALRKMSRNRPAKDANGAIKRAPSIKRRKGEGEGAGAGKPGNKIDEEVAKPTPNIRSVELANGGTITLSVSVDLFELGEEDRAFVVGLVDAVRGYAQTHPSRT